MSKKSSMALHKKCEEETSVHTLEKGMPQGRRKATAPAARCPRPTAALTTTTTPAATQYTWLLEEMESSDEGRDHDNGVIPATQFYLRQIQPLRTPTPPFEPLCTCALPASCCKYTCTCDNLSCLYHHDNKDVMHTMLKEMEWEDACVRREQLLTDTTCREKEKAQAELLCTHWWIYFCAHQKLLQILSVQSFEYYTYIHYKAKGMNIIIYIDRAQFTGAYIWQLGSSNHMWSTTSPFPFFLSLMVWYERGLRGHLNCVPQYFPHSTHTYSLVEHGDIVNCHFFAVLMGKSTGIYANLRV
jgi:hypothetical protein